jgi:Ser/Thr protein kinase RdoA (MazF antagonist)
MTHFPVTNSNLSAAHLGKFLQHTYAFGTDTQCQLIRAGINDTYLVTDGPARFVFRVYSLNWRTRAEISEEIRLLQRLRERNISVSHAIADKQGEWLQTLQAPEGERFGVLFSFAEGEKIHSVPAETHFRIGVAMARLHQASADMTLGRVTYTPQILLIDSLKQMERFLPDHTAEMQFMRETQDYLLKEFRKMDDPAIRRGVVHMDIWYDNLNIAADGSLTIFDFDFCGNGWPVLDLSYYILQLHNVERYDENAYQPKIDSFLEGYESITPISVQEKALFPMLGLSMYFFYLGIQCQRYENWSNSFLSENYLKRFINGLVRKYREINRL